MYYWSVYNEFRLDAYLVVGRFVGELLDKLIGLYIDILSALDWLRRFNIPSEVILSRLGPL